MKRARFVVVGGSIVLAALGGCASIIDIKSLDAPPATADAGDDGADAGGEAEPPCASEAGVANVTRTYRALLTALDDTDVYFTRADPSASAVLRCAKCGCAKPTELVTSDAPPAGVAVDERSVYWTNSDVDGGLSRFDKQDPKKTQTIAQLEQPFRVAVDDAFVYWTMIGGGAPDPLAYSGVWRARKADLSQRTRLAASNRGDDIIPYAIALDATWVYYTTAPNLTGTVSTPCDGSTGAIRRVRKTGGADQTPEVLVTGQPCPVALAVDATAIYWANFGIETAESPLPGSVRRKALDAAPDAGQLLADKQGRPSSVSLYGGKLAWNAPGLERVFACTPPACADKAPLASDQLNPSGLSADRSGIYWVVLGTPDQNFNDGALRRYVPP